MKGMYKNSEESEENLQISQYGIRKMMDSDFIEVLVITNTLAVRFKILLSYYNEMFYSDTTSELPSFFFSLYSPMSAVNPQSHDDAQKVQQPHCICRCRLNLHQYL